MEITSKCHLETHKETEEGAQEAPDNHLYFTFSRESLLFDAVLVLCCSPSIEFSFFALRLDCEVGKYDIHMNQKNFNSFPTCLL